MALPLSGQISIGDVRNELGKTVVSPFALADNAFKESTIEFNWNSLPASQIRSQYDALFACGLGYWYGYNHTENVTYNIEILNFISDDCVVSLYWEDPVNPGSWNLITDLPAYASSTTPYSDLNFSFYSDYRLSFTLSNSVNPGIGTGVIATGSIIPRNVYYWNDPINIKTFGAKSTPADSGIPGNYGIELSFPPIFLDRDDSYSMMFEIS
jgi:hypothetical protein